jgi:hypothetical protein
MSNTVHLDKEDFDNKIKKFYAEWEKVIVPFDLSPKIY